MNDLLVCNVCGGDRNKDMKDIKKLCIEKGLTGETCNPGGRKLWFGNKSIQLEDMCNSCDEKKIREFLKSCII